MILDIQDFNMEAELPRTEYFEETGLSSIFSRFISDEVLIKEGMQPDLLKNCLTDIGDKYNDVPYHNRHHAESVMLACETIFQSCVHRLASSHRDLDHIGLLFAASIHDIDHPGDTAADPLEHHHVDVAFSIIQKSDCNFLSTMSIEKKQHFEEMVRYLVLSTDMSQHEQKIRSFQMINFKDDICTSSNTINLLLSMILKCADLWHVVLPWPNHKWWTEQYLKEQGEDVNEITVQNQLWFLQVRCRPCFRALSRRFPSCKSYSRNLETNLSIWRSSLTAY